MSLWHSKTTKEVLDQLNVTAQSGLTDSEAKNRLDKYGPNELKSAEKESLFMRFLDQMKDPMIIVLLIAAVLSFVSSGFTDWVDSVIILLIVIVNAVISISQEDNAEKALEALRKMSAPLAKVIRNGSLTRVETNLLVPGDIIVLEAGDLVPADARILECANLKADEAAMTGESVPVSKNALDSLPEDTALGDRKNMVISSTVITNGRATCVVTSTGMETEVGQIAGMLMNEEDSETPLQKKMAEISKVLSVICLGVCVVMFFVGLLYQRPILEIFMSAVALAVAAIPEGLAAVVTIVLALGVQRMVKRNAIVKKLPAVETLGCASVICSDKTGTLTQNKMTIQKMYDASGHYNVSGTGYSPEGAITDEAGNTPAVFPDRLIEGALLCNDATYDPANQTIIGDPTEGAMVVLAHKHGMKKAEWEAKYPRLQEIPFDSDRKLMSTFHRIGDSITMYTKGAPDELLRRCTRIEEKGAVSPLSDAKREEILGVNQSMAQSALRVIGVAYRTMKEADPSPESENDLIFVGLVGMIDPPREEAKAAIDVCRTAGIQVKMITGDHKITASAIGAQLGIETDRTVEGREINEMSDEQLRECVKTTNVFARVSPEHKVRLVDAVRANGNIAAMTGDGVNDAPSLKHADIGVAMGITGTDVSKEAADMILTDDNFASIVRAVAEGRTIYANIRKVVGFLLSCNIGEILVIFLAMLTNLPTPLVAIQLLSINLITDAFPAFALGMEKEEPGTMSRKPRDPAEPIVDKKMTAAVLIQSVALALGTLGSFVYGLYMHDSLDVARSACFLTLVLGELLRAYSARSESTSVFKMKVFENSYLNKCVLVSVLFMIASIYVPFLNPVFSTVALSFDELIVALLLAFLPMLGGEAAKLVTKRM